MTWKKTNTINNVNWKAHTEYRLRKIFFKDLDKTKKIFQFFYIQLQ